MLHSLAGGCVKPGVDTFGKHGIGLQKVADRFDVVNVRRARLVPQQALDLDDEVVADAGVGRIALERVEGLNDLAQVFGRAAVFEAVEGRDGGADGGLGMPHEAGFVDQVIGQPRPKGFEPARDRGEEVGDLDGGAPGRMAFVESHRQDGRQLALGELAR